LSISSRLSSQALLGLNGNSKLAIHTANWQRQRQRQQQQQIVIVKMNVMFVGLQEQEKNNTIFTFFFPLTPGRSSSSSSPNIRSS